MLKAFILCTLFACALGDLEEFSVALHNGTKIIVDTFPDDHLYPAVTGPPVQFSCCINGSIYSNHSKWERATLRTNGSLVFTDLGVNNNGNVTVYEEFQQKINITFDGTCFNLTFINDTDVLPGYYTAFFSPSSNMEENCQFITGVWEQNVEIPMYLDYIDTTQEYSSTDTTMTSSPTISSLEYSPTDEVEYERPQTPPIPIKLPQTPPVPIELPQTPRPPLALKSFWTGGEPSVTVSMDDSGVIAIVTVCAAVIFAIVGLCLWWIGHKLSKKKYKRIQTEAHQMI